MTEFQEHTIEEIEEMIEVLVQSRYFDEKEEEIIKLHFGLKGLGRKTSREIGRLVKLPYKKTEIEIKRLEKRVFNLLKSR